jgi:predicted ester cyclase
MDRLRELVADDCLDHSAAAMGWKNGFLDHVRRLRGIISDMVIQVTDMVAEEDRVVSYWTLAGTHQGELAGTPSTGRRITGTAISQLRFRDGKLIEYQVKADFLSILQQIGVMPAWNPAAGFGSGATNVMTQAASS